MDTRIFIVWPDNINWYRESSWWCNLNGGGVKFFNQWVHENLEGFFWASQISRNLEIDKLGFLIVNQINHSLAKLRYFSIFKLVLALHVVMVWLSEKSCRVISSYCFHNLLHTYLQDTVWEELINWRNFFSLRGLHLQTGNQVEELKIRFWKPTLYAG